MLLAGKCLCIPLTVGDDSLRAAGHKCWTLQPVNTPLLQGVTFKQDKSRSPNRVCLYTTLVFFLTLVTLSRVLI